MSEGPKKLARNMKKKKSVIIKILCVGCRAVAKSLKPYFEKLDYVIFEEQDLTQASKTAIHEDVAVILFDQDQFLASDSSDFIKKCTKIISHPAVIVLTKNSALENFRVLLRNKIHDCLMKPFRTTDLIDSIKRGIEHRKSFIYGVRDPLTGLFNRYAFKEILRQEVDRAQRYDRHLSLLMIDIDFFKNVNDLFGHIVGDQVLEEVSEIITAAVRKTDVIARFGGEEFAIILPETTVGHATMLAERIRKKIEEHDYSQFIKKEKITVSIGISNYHTPGRRSDMTLVHSADQALYAAKKEGRNKVAISLPLKREVARSH